MRVLLFLALCLMAAAGCTTTLTPASHLQEPHEVYVLDHGRTSSLVIPDDQGGMIRYAYGDWDWYALRKVGAYRAIAALCWPTPAALGRRTLPGPPTIANAASRSEVYVQNTYAVPVDGQALRRVRTELERIYAANRATEIDTPSVGLSFVHHPDPYWWAHDSNHELATWLSDMGVKVRGSTLLSVWRVEQHPDR